MKTIGIIGGMSFESTMTYYHIINREVSKRLGGFHSAKIILHSVDFSEIEEYQSMGDWDKAGKVLAEIAVKLETAGADFIIIATNTMHKVALFVQNQINIPLLHIADAIAAAVKGCGYHKAVLLGTKYTMTQNFYKDRLVEQGLEVMIPNNLDIELVNHVIFQELCLGSIQDVSRKEYQRIIETLKQQGADSVILGCTEIGLLIQQANSSLPVFDSTEIHAKAAVDYALMDE